MNGKIQGVWSLESMDVGIGEKQRTRKDAKFMMYFMKKHYSAIRDFTPEPARIRRVLVPDAVHLGKKRILHPNAPLWQMPEFMKSLALI